MAFYSFGELLDLSTSRSKTPKALLALKIRSLWPQALTELFPQIEETMIKESRAKVFKDRVLIVEAGSTAWASHLRLNQKMIIRKLNLALGKNLIHQLRIRVMV